MTDETKVKKTRKKKAFKDGQAPAVRKRAAAKKAKSRADANHERTNGGKSSQSVVNTEKYQYERVVVETADGKKRHTADKGDRLAVALRPVSLADLHKIAKTYDIDPRKYADRNPGLQRMAIGNALRGVVRKGTTVEVAGKKIASLGD